MRKILRVGNLVQVIPSDSTVKWARSRVGEYGRVVKVVSDYVTLVLLAADGSLLRFPNYTLRRTSVLEELARCAE